MPPFIAAATPGTGKGTTIYVVDSGIRPTHQEFRTEDGTRTRALYGALPQLHALLPAPVPVPRQCCRLCPAADGSDAWRSCLH